MAVRFAQAEIRSVFRSKGASFCDGRLDSAPRDPLRVLCAAAASGLLSCKRPRPACSSFVKGGGSSPSRAPLRVWQAAAKLGKMAVLSLVSE